MSERPKVSVITPCFNAASFVDQMLSSVAAQDFSNWEHVLIDDGSTDNTFECLVTAAGMDSRLRVISQQNAGVAAARNRGISVADPASEFVIFLDADDEFEPGALTVLLARLKDDELCAAFGFARPIDFKGADLPADRDPRVLHRVVGRRVRKLVAPPELGIEYFVAITPISTPGQCLIRRRDLAASGAFDPEVVPCEDWDLWLRLAAHGRFGFVDQPILRYRKHGTNASSQHRLMQAQRRHVYQKHLTMAKDNSTLKELLRVGRPFGLYGYDAALSFKWAREALRRRELVSAGRLVVRSLRYRIKYTLAKRRSVERQHDDSSEARFDV